MSSTNRKNAKARSQSDFYVTPQNSIGEFFQSFNTDYPDFKPSLVLDPCAGGDDKHEMSYPAAIQKYSGWSNYKLGTIDIREDSRATIKADFLTWESPFLWDCVITNPPFCFAQEVIDKALAITKPDGLVIMLVRLNFYGSQGRKEWFQKQMPERSYLHSKRMSFTGGPTDSIEYQHIVYRRGVSPEFTKLKII